MEELQRLLAEQQALRRVATLVARGADRLAVFAAVTQEVGGLFGADVANLVRFEEGHSTIVGAWSSGGELQAPVGLQLPTSGGTLSAHIFRTGEPGRLDSYEAPDDEVARLRARGHRASVGAPVLVAGELWGAMLVGRARAEPFEAGDEHRLAAFAELVAQALANAEAQEQLAASRKRLVEASQVERRRLERNLHDGAQQRLVGLSLSLRLAERLVDRDPAAAREALARAGAELTEALAELRELARGLHPAVLTDHGLGPALAALASRAPVPIDVDVTLEGERPPEPVEAAAYFLAAEALTNMARYAFASGSRMTAWRERGLLVIEVADDGDGGADLARGSGLRGVADRVEALGGRFELRSPPGAGTLVRAELPEDA